MSDTRERFEKWANRHFVRIPVGCSPTEKEHGRYVGSNTELAWISWSACEKSLLSEIVEGMEARIERLKEIESCADWAHANIVELRSQIAYLKRTYGIETKEKV